MRKPVFAYAKTKTQISFAVTAKLISVFVFATRIVQFLYFLNPKFQASSHLVWLYSLVCVGLVGNPEDRFSHNEAQLCMLINYPLIAQQILMLIGAFLGWFSIIVFFNLQGGEMNYMSLVVRKLVFGVCDQVRQKLSCIQPQKMVRS